MPSVYVLALQCLRLILLAFSSQVTNFVWFLRLHAQLVGKGTLLLTW